MSISDAPPLRADARRNRAAIVKAARAVFARHGRDAQMDDVARRAKLGVGTLYRHFPTKEALLAALAEDRFRQLAELAQDALAIADPWDALETFMRGGARLHATDRALTEVLRERPELMRDAACERGDLQPAVERLVTRAQEAGVVRADVRWQDVPAALCAAGQTWGPPGASWERLIALVMDGMRAPSGTRLPD